MKKGMKFIEKFSDRQKKMEQRYFNKDKSANKIKQYTQS